MVGVLPLAVGASGGLQRSISVPPVAGRPVRRSIGVARADVPSGSETARVPVNGQTITGGEAAGDGRCAATGRWCQWRSATVDLGAARGRARSPVIDRSGQSGCPVRQ
jgi:hypothetical protein